MAIAGTFFKREGKSPFGNKSLRHWTAKTFQWEVKGLSSLKGSVVWAVDTISGVYNRGVKSAGDSRYTIFWEGGMVVELQNVRF